MQAIRWGCAAATTFCLCATARADFVGSMFDASMSYNTSVSAANSLPLMFRSDAMFNDLLDMPSNQLWNVESSDMAGMGDERILSFEFLRLDASAINAVTSFTLDLSGLDDGSGTAWEVTGPIFISFTPQMPDEPTIELTEGLHWSQANAPDDLDVTITVTPASVAPAGTFDADPTIDDVHVQFAVIIPEPASMLLLAAGLPCAIRRRRR